jgi:hypothetical protein
MAILLSKYLHAVALIAMVMAIAAAVNAGKRVSVDSRSALGRPQARILPISTPSHAGKTYRRRRLSQGEALFTWK